MGTADAGHYISYININRDQKSPETTEWLKTENDKWLEFNDSLVKDYKYGFNLFNFNTFYLFRFKSIEEDCFGGASSTIVTSNDFKSDYSKNAYMLIYDKRIKEKIKVVVPEELINKDNQ